MNSWTEVIKQLRRLETKADQYDPPVDLKLLAVAIEIAAALEELGCQPPARAYWSEESEAVMFEWVHCDPEHYAELEVGDEYEYAFRRVPLNGPRRTLQELL